jgi:hypothetical protein
MYLGVSITNSHVGVINEIHNILGYGYIATQKYDKYKTIHKLRLSCGLAYKFLKSVYPYLIIKKDQAYLAMKFQEAINNKKCRQQRVSLDNKKKRLEIKNDISKLCKSYCDIVVDDSFYDPEYYAGFLDGEGCICIGKRQPKRMINPSYTLNVVIVNQANVFLPLKKRFAGSISNRKKNGVLSYYISSKKAFNLLQELYPFLVVKKEQAKVALSFFAEHGDNVGKRFGVKGLPQDVVKNKEKYRQQLIAMK